MNNTEAKAQITSQQIVALLSARHTEDVFVPECKDGASQTRRHLRMDAWAMTRSWSNPCVTAYEIKVSRADFVQDDKWQGYLEYCNEFYFVCPSGIIKPDELPPEVGLLYVATTGTKLFQKKKPQRRVNVAIPERLLRYILMSRARIVESQFGRHPDEIKTREQVLREWIERNEEKSKLSYLVSRKIRTRVDEVERDNEKLRKQNESFEDVRRVLDGLGISREDGHWRLPDQVKDRLNKIEEIIPQHVIRNLQQAKSATERTLEAIEALKAKHVTATAA